MSAKGSPLAETGLYESKDTGLEDERRAADILPQENYCEKNDEERGRGSSMSYQTLACRIIYHPYNITTL